MAAIKGISIQKTENYTTFLIATLSDELKSSIRERLAAVCHGVANVESGSEIDSFHGLLNSINVNAGRTLRSETYKTTTISRLFFHAQIDGTSKTAPHRPLCSRWGGAFTIY